MTAKLPTVQEVSDEVRGMQARGDGAFVEPTLRAWAEAIMQAVLDQQHRGHKLWDELHWELGLDR